MRVVLGQPVGRPSTWVVNVEDEGGTVTHKVVRGPQAKKLAGIYARGLARQLNCEMIER